MAKITTTTNRREKKTFSIFFHYDNAYESQYQQLSLLTVLEPYYTKSPTPCGQWNSSEKQLQEVSLYDTHDELSLNEIS